MPIDTLKAARRLQEKGTFDEEQAERIAEVLSELDVASATKEDLNELEDRLTTRIDRVAERSGAIEGRIDEVREQLTDRLDARIAKLERRLLVAGVPAIAAIVAILNYLMG